ncbi:hypothetical protein SAMN05216299_11229 [Nitrosospira sp. Nsp14]|uniref:hypothetical protein n=1 Tax=Nitrosospira sp. Nsp14 TaxID=1855333 RepID=UPI0008DF5E74|nr:hypothetical protein [Nitrosospira sp. Nsp14]SFH42777.1 hypothetical protein SAMN05216299_11229 [Nitrosospira sp. Nsp14]
MVISSSNAGLSYRLPRIVDASSTARLELPPTVPRSLIPIPFGPVMKARIAPHY